MLDEVEAAIFNVAVQILRGDGFCFDIPSRSKGNQLYVPELDRIVLKDSMSQRPFASASTCRKAVITARILQLVHELCVKRIHVTKRDLFYTDVKLFEVRGCALLCGFALLSGKRVEESERVAGACARLLAKGLGLLAATWEDWEAVQKQVQAVRVCSCAGKAAWTVGSQGGKDGSECMSMCRHVGLGCGRISGRRGAAAWSERVSVCGRRG